MNRFDRLFWRRLWTLGRPYWVSDQRWLPLGLLALSLLLTGSIKGFNVVFSYVNRDMMTALTDKNGTLFLKVLVKPLVNLIWAAGLLFVFGSLVALWPDAVEQRRLAQRYEGAAAART